MQISMMMVIFSVFDHKYFSWANLVKKLKIFFSKWKLFKKLEYPEFNGDVHFICFRQEIPILGNLIQKIKIISLKETRNLSKNLDFEKKW